MPKAFVCGHPVAHSRSPLVHGYWLKRYDITGSYDAIDIEPERFSSFLRGISGNDFIGGNVTIPHKEAAFELVDILDKAAGKIGAVNTIWLEDDKLFGGNTDWSGFAANLDSVTPGWEDASNAVILGAGGAARGILYALIQRGIPDIRIVNRTRLRAEQLASDFSDGTAYKISVFDWSAQLAALQDSELLVNTTSLGMNDSDTYVPDLTPVSGSAIVSDIVYTPLETPLLRAARESGLKTVDGLGMLLHQAVPGFEKWFGVRPEVTPELRDLVLRDMGSHR